LHTIEQAIRHALQNIDADNPTMRNKLYQATWQTHEKMLASITQVSEEEKQARRESLKKIIQTIESEFYQQAVPASRQPIEAQSPPIIADPARVAKQSENRKKKNKISLRGNGFLLVLIAILLIIAWVFYNSLIGSRDPADSGASSPENADQVASLIRQEQEDAVVSNPPSDAQQNSVDRRWITIFDPGNIEGVRIKGGAQVQLQEDELGRFLRLTTHDAEEGIVIEIGRGLMAQLEGKSTIFNIIARNATDMITQLSVACDFGMPVSCGRWRFELPPTRDDLLFGVDVADRLQGNSPATFSLSLTGEASNAPYMVDIFGLEVSFDD